VAHTRTGWISCHTLVFATGYEFPEFVPLDGHRLLSTYAIATRPQPRRLWPGEVMIWEASDPYLYCRRTSDGRAIIGGEDEPFVDEASRDGLLSEKAARLAEKTSALLPRLDARPVHRWTGTFGASETGLPTIGTVPGCDNVWAVLGYGGNGIVYSRMAAEIIRSALAGRTDPDADLFAFRRPPPRR
jgi:glycine/D-amino acid oxidase-like deaminating enzyme